MLFCAATGPRVKLALPLAPSVKVKLVPVAEPVVSVAMLLTLPKAEQSANEQVRYSALVTV